MHAPPSDPEPLAPRRTVVVVGGGFAGTSVAVRLLAAASDLDVVLVDAAGRFGPGVAYATRDPLHLLNVPAGRLSIDPDDDDGFVRWARAEGQVVEGSDFLPRGVYGDYLRHALDRADRDSRGRGCVLRRLDAIVLDVVRDGSRELVRLQGAPDEVADAVVLALGPPDAAPIEELPDHPTCFVDPWQPGALDPLPAGSTVLLVGSGLTAVDAAVRLTADDLSARVVAISRSGSTPFAHADGPLAPAPPPEWPPGPLSLGDVVAGVHAHVAAVEQAGGDWRAAIDSLRPQVQELWRGLTVDDQRRFLRDHARTWEVRRHRMAPQVAARIAQARVSGRLEVRAGSIASAQPDGARIQVALTNGTTLAVDRVVRCTGPSTRVDLQGPPLARRLVEGNRAEFDPLRLGLRATAGGKLFDPRTSSGSDSLWLLGALRRGELWETTAVPELRQQAAVIVANLMRGRA